MSDLCSQLAPCLLLLHHLFRLLLHHLRCSSGLLIMSATTMTTKRESPKCRAFAFVAASSSSLSFVFVFVFVFGIRRSSLAVFCLAFVSYFLDCFRPKYLAVCIYQCGYCLLLILLLLPVIVSVIFAVC